MSTLSAQEMSALKAELQGAAYANLDGAARQVVLHSPEQVPNPAPQGQVPNPCYESALMGLLTDAQNGSAVKLVVGFSNFGLLKADIESGNRTALNALWCPVLAAAGLITVGECQEIQKYLDGTTADPAWSATVAGPSPKQRLFGAQTWLLPDKTRTDYIPLADIEATS